jgi:ADP-ribosylglycohydrolase
MHQPPATSRELERYQSRVAGCLLGGALGDALGAPVEFDSLQEITERYGEAGLTGLVPYRGRLGLVTDDTQMTLFTAEGLIAAALSGARSPERIGLHLYRSYRRWLATQELSRPPYTAQTWLERQAWLYDRRAPGHACLSGLAGPAMGTLEAPANPGSKGCGTVMRSAPFGLQPGQEPEAVFREAVAGAVLSQHASHRSPGHYREDDAGWVLGIVENGVLGRAAPPLRP